VLESLKNKPHCEPLRGNLYCFISLQKRLKSPMLKVFYQRNQLL